MEWASDLADRAAALLAALPAFDETVPGDPAIWIVGASVLAALGTMGLVTGWVDGRVARVPLLSTLAAACLLAWIRDADPEGFGPMTVPVAFVEVAARVVR